MRTGRTQIGQFGRYPDRQADRRTAVQNSGYSRSCHRWLTTLCVHHLS